MTHMRSESANSIAIGGVQSKTGVNFHTPLFATRPRSVPVALSSRTDGVTHSSLLSPLHSLLAFVRSGLRPSLVRGDSPRNAPHTPCHDGAVQRGMLSMPPVAHPCRAAKPSAVTTVGAGLVPALSHPRIGLHPIGVGNSLSAVSNWGIMKGRTRVRTNRRSPVL